VNLLMMDEFLWQWFNKRLPVTKCEDSVGLVMTTDKGRPMAGCVFDSFTDNSAQCHLLIVNPMCLKHEFFHYCAEYIFFTRDKKYVFGQIPSNNEKALHFNRLYGYQEVARLPNAFKDGVDCVIMEHSRERYLQMFPNHKELVNG